MDEYRIEIENKWTEEDKKIFTYKYYKTKLVRICIYFILLLTQYNEIKYCIENKFISKKLFIFIIILFIFMLLLKRSDIKGSNRLASVGNVFFDKNGIHKSDKLVSNINYIIISNQFVIFKIKRKAYTFKVSSEEKENLKKFVLNQTSFPLKEINKPFSIIKLIILNKKL